jgi:hypothetical protein
MVVQPFVGPWFLLQFRNLFYTDGRTPWTSDQPVARPLPAHRTTQSQKKSHTQTSMPRVGFEPMIPVFERVKTVHALDGAATAIGLLSEIPEDISIKRINCEHSMSVSQWSTYITDYKDWSCHIFISRPWHLPLFRLHWYSDSSIQFYCIHMLQPFLLTYLLLYWG